MLTVTFLSRKGGAGKTTLACAVAVAGLVVEGVSDQQRTHPAQAACGISRRSVSVCVQEWMLAPLLC